MDLNAMEKTLQMIRESQQSSREDLLKAFLQSATATSGLTAYSLEAPAKLLYPVLTPLRNSIPRVTGGAGIQANWRAITGVNTSKLSAGLGEGNRGGVVQHTTADYIAKFAGMGFDNYASMEATWAGQGFDDIRAKAAMTGLQSLMLAEEATDLGGNAAAVALGTTPTPSATGADTGGALTQGTWNVYCVALTLQGYLQSSVAGGVVGSYVRTNADASTDTIGGGAGQISAGATASVGAVSVGSITATVAAVKGAVAYAWYWGISTVKLGAITTINSVKITDVAAGTQLSSEAPSSDLSKNTLVYDGLLYQAWKTGSGAYDKVMATGTAGTGTALTSDSNGGIVEINEALQYFWDTYRLSPTRIWVNSQEQKNITSKIYTAGQYSAQQFVIPTDQAAAGGGVVVRWYLNPFSMGGAEKIPVQIHPNLPPGTIFFDTDTLPYPASGVANVKQKLLRAEYYQIEWPMRSRKYEYGVYFDGVLQNYFPGAFGTIRNIANA